MKKNKKKKGFTLIELVIVLAVLAIIALIAIPNFNKVRTDSQKKADERTCEVIERVTLMAIADQDMVVTLKDKQVVKIPVGAPQNKGEHAIIGTHVLENLQTRTGGNVSPTLPGSVNLEWKEDGQANYAKALKEIKKPQVKGQNSYLVIIDANENVKVETSKDTVVNAQ